MNGKNSVQLVGYVGQDIKETKSEKGHRVAIRMATHFYLVKAPGGQIGADHLAQRRGLGWAGGICFAKFREGQ
jgi:hypothetical protein